jgi:DNA-directed RNA polymerase sigma subunit (sigma70/sigma32)
MVETPSRRSAMTLARGNHRLPSLDESWPYPDPVFEDGPSADDEVDLDALELRVDPRAYLGLDPEEREVLFLRFGLADGRARSMKEIARTLDVTHSQARELLGRAIEKVRTRVALEA